MTSASSIRTVGGSIIAVFVIVFGLIEVFRPYPNQDDLQFAAYRVGYFTIDTTYVQDRLRKRPEYELRIVMANAPIYVTFKNSQWMMRLNSGLITDSTLRVWYKEDPEADETGNRTWGRIGSQNVYQIGTGSAIVMPYVELKRSHRKTAWTILGIGLAMAAFFWTFFYFEFIKPRRKNSVVIP